MRTHAISHAATPRAQSDWMIGGCAESANATFVRTLGCNTCDKKRLSARGLRASVAKGCFFAQNFVRPFPVSRFSPAIVHNLPASAAGSLRRKFAALDALRAM